MEPLFYVIAIMGCADGSAGCSDARVLQAHYPTISACQAAMPAALMRNTDLAFPEITATCRGRGAARIAEQQPRRAARRAG